MQQEQAVQTSLLPVAPPALHCETVALVDLAADVLLLGAPPEPALVASIRRYGVLQPVLLIRTGSGALVVAEGRRRVKAARLAGLATLPAWVTTGDESAAAAFGLVTHGTRRENPAAELDAIERLLALGASEQVIARETGLRVPTIRQRLRLARLDPTLRQALRLGRLAVGVAEQAATLPAPAQQRLAVRLAEVGKVTAMEVAAERQVRRQEATAALPFALLTAVPSAESSNAAPPSDDTAVSRLLAWLETALATAAKDDVRDVAALGRGLLLVQLADGSACTIQVSAGAPAYADVA